MTGFKKYKELQVGLCWVGHCKAWSTHLCKTTWWKRFVSYPSVRFPGFGDQPSNLGNEDE